MASVLFVFFMLLVLGAVIYLHHKQEQRKAAAFAAVPLETRMELAATNDHAPRNAVMVCPHC